MLVEQSYVVYFESLDHGASVNMSTPVVPPQSEWGLDPLYWSHVRVTIAQVHALLDVRQLSGAFVFAASRRPVARVEVVGNIVNIKVSGCGTT